MTASNVGRLQREHTREAIARRLSAATSHSYVGDFILGAVDGAVTTFAIVAGAAGAGLSNGIALILGLANVLADGLSMAAGNFLRARANQDLLAKFRRIEAAHIEDIPDGEREEVRQIYRAKGFEGEVLEQIVKVITNDRRLWIDTMLTDEWGLQLQPASPWRAGVATFAAFVLAGMIPLLPALFSVGRHADETFVLSSMLTGATFVLIGLLRGWLVEGRPLYAAVETLLVGGLAASTAYFIGKLLQSLAVS